MFASVNSSKTLFSVYKYFQWKLWIKCKIDLYVGNNKIVYVPDKPRYDVP